MTIRKINYTVIAPEVEQEIKDKYTKLEIDSKMAIKADLDGFGKILSSQLPSYVDDVLEFDSLSVFPSIGETGKIYVAMNTNLTYRWSGTSYIEISPSLALGETSSAAYRGDRGKIAYDHSQTLHAPSNATANDTDANLKNRSNHTGTQLSSTISDFANTVRGTILTGLSTITNATISATDTVLIALGKLQKQISDNLSSLNTHIGNKNNPHSVTKLQLGIENIDNTSDLNKPISVATQIALDNKVDNSRVLTDVPLSAKFTDTITTINGKTGVIAKSDIVALGIPSQDTVYTHPITSGNKHIPSGGSIGQFLKWESDGTATWSSAGAGGLELGETSSTAYRGDRGKVAYDHSQSAHAPVDSISKTNTTLYTPTSNYHPATKKYVDDNSGLIIP